ncbi:unnamed protein product [Discula destructiva]
MPTALADNPPPPSQASETPAATAEATPLVWTPPVASPLAIWNRKRKIRLDRRPARAHVAKEKLIKTTGQLGAVVVERFNPSSLLRDPPRPEDVTLELLMASQCHMGHHKSLWNPAMQRYIYGVRADIHVFALEEIAAALRRAAKVVEQVAYLGGLILFVGNRKGQMEVTARAAEMAGACHLFTKWVPGTITNRDQILGKEELKIVDHKDRQIIGFERHLLERRPLMPELVVVLNPLENFTLLHECAQENIPTIGLVDTNGDPTKVTYTIPGNDDSLRAVSVIAGVLGRAGEAGQKRRRMDAARGLCTWRNPPEIQRWLQANLSRSKKAEAAEKEEALEAEDGPDAAEDEDMNAVLERKVAAMRGDVS